MRNRFKFALAFLSLLCLYQDCFGQPKDFGHSTSEQSSYISDLIARFKNGDPKSQFQLGRIYANGNGVPRRLEKAVELFLRSTRSNYPDLSRKWLKRAQAEGFKEADNLLLKMPAQSASQSSLRPKFSPATNVERTQSRYVDLEPWIKIAIIVGGIVAYLAVVFRLCAKNFFFVHNGKIDFILSLSIVTGLFLIANAGNGLGEIKFGSLKILFLGLVPGAIIANRSIWKALLVVPARFFLAGLLPFIGALSLLRLTFVRPDRRTTQSDNKR